VYALSPPFATANPVTHILQRNLIDTGLVSVALMNGFLGVAIDVGLLRHQLGVGTEPATADDLVRATRLANLRARATRTRLSRLPGTPLPAIAELSDQRFCILCHVAEETGRVAIQRIGKANVRTLPYAEFAREWTGRLILVTRRSAVRGDILRFDLGWFIPPVLHYKRVLGEVLGSSLVLQLLALASPIVFQVVIDKVLVHRGLSTLDVLAVALVLLGVFECILTILRNYLFVHTANRIDVELGARLYEHLMALPVPYFVARRVGDSVARVRELETLRNCLTSSALTATIDLVFTVIFLAVMACYSLLLTGAVIASSPFYIALSLIATPMFRARLNEKFARNAENHAFLVESVTGVETLKALAVEPQMQRRWEEQLAAYVHSAFRAQSLGHVAAQLIQFIGKMTTAATLYLDAYAVINGDLTVSELVAFNMLAQRVAAPMLRIAQLWLDFHQARISVERLGDILNSPREQINTASLPTLPPVCGHVRFEDVTFRYLADGPAVLSDVPAGQVLGIVGTSGSGKSTLTKLVQRLYVPEKGQAFVDGIDIALIDASWLRRQLGVALQDNILFNRSVRDNIGLVDPSLPMEQIIEAAELAGAREFITRLPYGYDTEIGERATSLSGGQRQRIAIARALVADPRILIFDEATSALDYQSEQVIQTNMRRIVTGRTVFIIAHRLSTVRGADRIITIDRGCIVEDGTHAELLRCDGRYAMLHRLQLGNEHVPA
jgi:subfamily B ATP-binding cassette protein HlyB/CyaB